MAQSDLAMQRQTVVPNSLRAAMSRFATGVAVLTASHGGKRFGMTVNSLTSVSLEPPQILVCINRDSSTGAAVQVSRRFAVSLLDRDQRGAAHGFVGPNGRRFDTIPCTPSSSGLPLVRGALASLACDVSEVLSGGDHDIVIGNVVECAYRDGEPLVFFGGAFGGFEAHPPELVVRSTTELR